MGTRTSYRPGTFSWVDLATTDAAVVRAERLRRAGGAEEERGKQDLKARHRGILPPTSSGPGSITATR